MPKGELFGGKGAQEYNAIHEAFKKAARDAGHSGEDPIYAWLDETPKTSIMVTLVDCLNENGFEIRKRK